MILGFFIFKIRRSDISKSIDFREVQKKIPLEDMRFITKGEKITVDQISSFDLASYEKKFRFDKDYEHSPLDEFLGDILKYESGINDLLSQDYKFELDFHIHSEMAQIAFELTNQNIKFLEKLGVDLNYYILSDGLVEDI